MSMFSVQILGSNSSTPSFGRFLSCQHITIDNHSYLMDCGEGSQFQLVKYRVKRNRIKAIFISHLHGDHVFGLPGVISSFVHFNRIEPLIVIGPTGLREFLDTIFRLSNVHLNFEVEIREISETNNFQLIYEDYRAKVYSFPLRHRITTHGYVFEEKINKHNLDPKILERYQLSYDEIIRLKKGEDIITESGVKITVKEACIPKPLPRKYAYMSDTVFIPEATRYIHGVNLLYHEATYLSDLSREAAERMHATSKQAATIAQLAGVEKLLLGHYSSRYADLSPFLLESREVFPNSHLAIEGFTFEIER